MNANPNSQETIERVVDLYGEGLTSRHVAEIMTKEMGRVWTRNAVLGVVYRNVHKSAKRTKPTPHIPEEYTGPIRACQYPHGDPGSPEFHFCGQPTVTGKPYCRNHSKVCYRQELVE